MEHTPEPAAGPKRPRVRPGRSLLDVLLRIRQISGNALEIPQGSLYPALYRLEHQGLIKAEWGESENKRRAKFYTLTARGRTRLKEETAGWNRLAEAIGAALNATIADTEVQRAAPSLARVAGSAACGRRAARGRSW